jgi:hypothetical protein
MLQPGLCLSFWFSSAMVPFAPFLFEMLDLNDRAHTVLRRD